MGVSLESRTAGGVGGELLAQDQLHDYLLALAAEDGREDSKDEQRVGQQDSDHVRILRQTSGQYESDSQSQRGISSIVDRPPAERRNVNDSDADGY